MALCVLGSQESSWHKDTIFFFYWHVNNTESHRSGEDLLGQCFLNFGVCLNLLKMLAEKAGALATSKEILTQ